jgi:hypothetical protein
MEFGSPETGGGGMRWFAVLLLATAAVTWGQTTFEFDVRHERALRDHPGRVTFDERGVEYRQVLTAKQAKKKKQPKLESARWDYQDIQQVWLAQDKIVLVTYRDRKWFLGIDREFEFYVTGKDQPLTPVYELLKNKLDQRFVAAVADPNVTAEWEIPAKLLGTIQGSEGVLRVGADRIVYQTSKKNQARTWRLEDLENISTSGPFQLTLTTYERAISHYGGMKGFNFQLKQRLDSKRFDELWRRLNRDKGLEFLTAIQERNRQK